MTNILLTLSYDGTDFCGWQRQDKSASGQPVRTVQGELENALERMFRQKINLYGSGRTDSGVHAHAQAANFFSPVDGIQSENYVRALNGLLPPDIRIMKAEKKDGGRGAERKYFHTFTSRITDGNEKESIPSGSL